MSFLATFGRVPPLERVTLTPLQVAPRTVELREARVHVTQRCEVCEDAVYVPARALRSLGSPWVNVTRQGEDWLVEQDALGMVPVYWVQRSDGVAVSTEVKALCGAGLCSSALREEAASTFGRAVRADFSPFVDVARLPAGARLRVRDGVASVERGGPSPVSLEVDAQAPAELERALTAAAASLPGGTWGVALSGGIDSGIAAALAARGHRVIAFTLQTELGDEVAGARARADSLGLELRVVRLERADVLDAFTLTTGLNEAPDGLGAEIAMQFVPIFAAAAKAGVQHLITGYGSDLLFGGMLRHEAYMRAVGATDTPGLLARTQWTGETRPHLAWAFGLELHHPFFAPDVVRAATACEVRPAEVEKQVLRSLAVRAGWLTQADATARKQAMTDGTRANRLLSDALGLSDVHAYDAKTRALLAPLRELVSQPEPLRALVQRWSRG